MPSDRESRRIAQQRVVEAMARHTSYLHRASTAQINAMHEVINDLSGDMLREIGERLDNLTPAELQAFARGRYTTDRLKGVRKVIDGWAVKMGERITTLAKDGFEELAGHEAKFARRLIAESVEGSFPAAPAAAPVYAAAMAQPLLGEMVEDMLSDIPERTKRQVYARMRQGIAQGETNHQIIRALRGTKALNYKDGTLNWARNEVDRVVRTARNHISNVAYEETYEALGVEEVVDVATLDGKVSKYCASIDGRRHKVGTNHPRPPYHPHCRTMQAPSFDGQIMGRRPYVRSLKVQGNEDRARFRSIGEMTKKQREEAQLEVGQVAAGTNYPKWFGNQPASFQKEWLGPTRYKLYKEGGYTIDRFVDPIRGELTIEQLRQRDAATFKELFG